MPGPVMDTSVKASGGAFHFNVKTAFTFSKLAVPDRERSSSHQVPSAQRKTRGYQIDHTCIRRSAREDPPPNRVPA
jgi:hypothetical protein